MTGNSSPHFLHPKRGPSHNPVSHKPLQGSLHKTAVSWLDNGPQRYQVLILGAYKCYLVGRKGLCRCGLVKDLKTGRLLWIIWGGRKHNVFIKERQREIKHRRGKGNIDLETGGRDWSEWCSCKAGTIHSHQMLEERGQEGASPLKCQGLGQAPDTRYHQGIEQAAQETPWF